MQPTSDTYLAAVTTAALYVIGVSVFVAFIWALVDAGLAPGI